MADFPAWPAILTNADWQKKKGTIAKIAGKTGIGEAMTAAKTGFDKIDIQLFRAETALQAKDRDPDKIVAAKQACIQAHAKTVEPTRLQIKNVRDKATQLAAAWQKNKLIPESSRKHLEEVAKAADVLSLSLAGNSQSMGEALKSFDKMLEIKKKAELEEQKKLSETISNLEKVLLLAEKQPTINFWKDGQTSPHQRCRSMCNAIRNIPKLKTKYWATWQKFGDEYHRDAKPGPAEAETMKKKIATVKTALVTFKASYQKDLA